MKAHAYVHAQDMADTRSSGTRGHLSSHACHARHGYQKHTYMHIQIYASMPADELFQSIEDLLELGRKRGNPFDQIVIELSGNFLAYACVCVHAWM